MMTSVVCVISDISRDKLKVPLDVFIILTVPDIGHTPHTLTIRGRGQVRVQPTERDNIIKRSLTLNGF